MAEITEILARVIASAHSFVRSAAWIAVMAVALLSSHAAVSEPVTLKLSFFTSDRSSIYQCQIKPFVDAVNADGEGLIHIDVYFSGAISNGLAEQPRIVATDVADLAIVSPGISPQRFADSVVMTLPGLFRDAQEASIVFTRLVEAGALEGYKEFFVVGAFVSAGESIHSRKAVATLSDLRGQTIRVNNPIEGEALRRFGAVPVLLPINRTMEALSQRTLDGVSIPPSMLFEFGFGRLTSNHYLLHLGGAPVALLMNRKKLSSLPQRAQEIVRKYSGEWLAEKEVSCFDAKDRETVAHLEADSRRKVTFPSAADLAASERVFASVVEEWAALSPHNRELLSKTKLEIAKIRSSK